MRDTIYSVAELAQLTGKTVRHVRRLATTIPGHFITGKRGHAFRRCPPLLDWIEEHKRPDVVELPAKSSGVVGGEVVEAARTYHDRLKAHARRASLTKKEKSEFRRWCAAIAKLPALCR